MRHQSGRYSAFSENVALTRSLAYKQSVKHQRANSPALPQVQFDRRRARSPTRDRPRTLRVLRTIIPANLRDPLSADEHENGIETSCFISGLPRAGSFARWLTRANIVGCGRTHLALRLSSSPALTRISARSSARLCPVNDLPVWPKRPLLLQLGEYVALSNSLTSSRARFPFLGFI